MADVKQDIKDIGDKIFGREPRAWVRARYVLAGIIAPLALDHMACNRLPD